MKKKMPSEGLRLGRDSGSILCDTLKKWRFRTGWGGGLQWQPQKNIKNKQYLYKIRMSLDYFVYFCSIKYKNN